MDRVTVTWRDPGVTYPGLRSGNVVSWINPADVLGADFGNPEQSAQRNFLLLDIGVKMAIPNVWVERGDPLWYVDLVIVGQTESRFDLIDLDIDLFVPTDGRPYRTLDLNEFADAIEDGEFTIEQAIDGLRRWQTFLDLYIHIFGPGKDVDHGWLDFPPECIMELRRLPDEAFVQGGS